ncbi:nitrite reductase small subunit NirD [Paenibacillus aurantius]
MNRYPVGSIEEIPFMRGRVVSLGKQEIAVFRLSNGEVKAVENRCPHKGGPLSEGIVSGGNVYCPLHDWKVCLRSGDVQEPDRGCVKTYQVEVIGSEIFLYTESPVTSP